MIVLCLLLLLMLNPLTRQIIILILPMGSGIDDFVFCVVLLAAVVVALMRVLTVREPLRKIAEWFLK
jgi:hypothetical protein